MLNIKAKSLSLILMTCLSFSSYANTEEDTLDIAFSHVTSQELAALAVIHELCPTLINVDKNYHNGFKLVVQDYLPDAKNPVAELQIRTKSAEYKDVMNEAYTDAKQAGDDANRAICEDIRLYGKNNN